MPEPLDIENRDLLLMYLREARKIGPLETPKVQTLAGGVSNRTVLVERQSGESWVLKQALHKLRTSADWYCDPARVDREALGLRHLATIAPAGAITPLVFEDPVHHLLAMQAVPQPHRNWKTMLLGGQLDASHVRQFAELLATIHRGGAERCAQLRPVFEDDCFFHALRLEPYYEYAAEQEQGAAEFLKSLVADTRSRKLTIVHGDYSPKNILVHDDKLVLLDHEVIHWGDPAFDVGFALTHLLSKALHLKAQRSVFALAAEAFWESYRSGVGDSILSANLESMSVRQTIGCLLARVSGRSPLEYLDTNQRHCQRDACLSLIASPPATVPKAIKAFIAAIDRPGVCRQSPDPDISAADTAARPPEPPSQTS